MTARPSAGCAWTYKTMPANRSPKPSRWSAWRHQSLPLRARSLTSPGQGTRMIQTEMSRRPLSSPRARCEVVMQGVIGEAPLERQAQAGSSKPSSSPNTASMISRDRDRRSRCVS